jgi:quinol monooxygenase YgiN
VPIHLAVIELVLRIIARPKGVQPMIQALRSLMLPIQLDRGCGGCHLYADVGESNSLLYVEKWATRKNLEREMQSNRFTRLLSVMESSPEPPVLEFWFVSQSQGLEYFAEVRNRPTGPVAMVFAGQEQTPASTSPFSANNRLGIDSGFGSPLSPDSIDEAPLIFNGESSKDH